MTHTCAEPKEDRLSRFSAGVQEACWLGAACVIPLLLSPRGTDIAYQPFKYGVWMILSAIGMAAWFVRAVNLGSKRQSFYGNPLLIVLGLLGLFGLISVWFSVDRASSLWGAPETFQGIAAWLAALGLAALVSCNLRKPEQLHRLVSVMILSGFAAGLLAILQRAGFDPRHPQLEGMRCHSTAGHSIYLGGYLLMVIPLTLWRLLGSGRLAGIPRWVETISGTLILAVQVAGFIYTESRGPTVGIGAMLLAFGVFLAVHHRRRSWLLAICGLCACAAIGIGVIYSSKSAHDFGSELPILKRFLESKSAGAEIDVFRAETWKHMPRMMVGDRALPTPSGGSDGLHGMRLLLGYGPETLQSVFPQERACFGYDKIENRFHNLVWDQFFFYGLPGLLGLLAVMILTFYRGFQLLGWMVSRRESVIFALAIGSCGAVGATVAGVALKVGFIGMGLLCGIAAGTLVFALIRAMRTPPNDDAQLAGTFPCGLLIAIMAGLVGHLVDMAFIFHSAPTAVMFWLSIGMVHSIRYVPISIQRASPSSLDKTLAQPPDVKPLTSTTGNAALLALGVVTLLFGCLHQYSYSPMTFDGILKVSLFQPKPIEDQASLLWMLPVALLLIGGPILAMPVVGNAAAGFVRRALRVILVAGLVGGIYCILQIFWIRAIGSVPIETAPVNTVLKQAMAYDQLFFIYLAIAGLLLVLAAWDLARPYPSYARTPIRGWFATGLAGVAVVSGCWQFALRPLQANLSSQWASALIALGRPEFANEVYRRAIRLDPQPFAYRGLLATSLMDSAYSTKKVDEARVLLVEAENVLLAGRAISEFNRSHFLLGKLYLQRAHRESPPARDATAAQAARAFAMATAFEPHQEQPWTYASIVDRLLLNDPVAADKKLDHALRLTSNSSDVTFTNYAALGLNTPDPRLRAEFARIAILHFDRLSGTAGPQGIAMAKFEKARLLLANRGDVGIAEILLREAIPGVRAEVSWKANGMLAEILMAKGDAKGAVIALKNALQTAPENMRQPIAGLIIKLGGAP
jgi:tetratricopeptide (TPR) repeat protein